MSFRPLIHPTPASTPAPAAENPPAPNRRFHALALDAAQTAAPAAPAPTGRPRIAMPAPVAEPIAERPVPAPAAPVAASTPPAPPIPSPARASTSTSTSPAVRSEQPASQGYQRAPERHDDRRSTPSAATPSAPPARAPATNPDGTPRKGREYWEEFKKLRDYLRNNLRLDRVLDALGADGNQDRDKSKYKIHGYGNIITAGQRWQNVNSGNKGFGPVKLIEDVMAVNDEAAVQWLVKQFGEEIPESARTLEITAEERKVFQPPQPDTRALDEVRQYLVGQRGLPPSLIESEIRRYAHNSGAEVGGIYATHPVNKETGAINYFETRCVFLGPLSAEVRSTDPQGFKGTCEGADPEVSGYRVMCADEVNEEILSLQEAAVDCLSYRTLFPGRVCLSTNGAGRPVLQLSLALEALVNEYGIRAAFDADWAGDQAAQMLFNAFYVRQYLSHRLKVDPEIVDQWFLEHRISAVPGNSPHELFFNHEWKPELPVRVEKETFSASGERSTQWVDHPEGLLQKPTIRLLISRDDLHPDLKRGILPIEVAARGYDYVIQTMRLRRERPLMGKDWNDELRRLGSGYIQEYERRAQFDFQEGAPALPAHLARLREPAPMAYQPPAEPPRASASTGPRL